MIDDQIAKFNLNPQTSYQLCGATGQIQTLDKVANTQLGRNYAVDRQIETMSILKKFEPDIVKKEAVPIVNDKSCFGYTRAKVNAKYPNLEIVASTSSDAGEEMKEGQYEFHITFQFTLKENRGLFRKDNFIVIIANTVGYFGIECSSVGSGSTQHHFETKIKQL